MGMRLREGEEKQNDGSVEKNEFIATRDLCTDCYALTMFMTGSILYVPSFITGRFHIGAEIFTLVKI